MIHTVITDALEARTQGQIIQEVHHIPLSVSLVGPKPSGKFQLHHEHKYNSSALCYKTCLACARQRQFWAMFQT